MDAGQRLLPKSGFSSREDRSVEETLLCVNWHRLALFPVGYNGIDLCMTRDLNGLEHARLQL